MKSTKLDENQPPPDEQNSTEQQRSESVQNREKESESPVNVGIQHNMNNSRNEVVQSFQAQQESSIELRWSSRLQNYESSYSIPKVISLRLSQGQSYLYEYNMEQRTQIEGMYLAIKKMNSNFAIPDMSTLSREGKTAFREYGRKTNEICRKIGKIKKTPNFLIFHQRLGEKIGFERCKVPSFQYTLSNVCSLGPNHLISLKRKNCYKRINKEGKAKFIFVENNCLAAATCYCETRREYIFKNFSKGTKRNHLKYKKNGHLDMEGYDTESNRADFVVECSNVCKCDISCPQRALQKGSDVPLGLGMVNEDKGLGVYAGADISPGQFICELVGRLVHITDPGACKPTMNFEFDYPGVPFLLTFDEMANFGRFLNHSCEPNAFVVNVFSRVEEGEKYIPRVGIFALKEIRAGEEITYSYNNYSTEEREASQVSECKCGAPKCRKKIVLLK